MKLVTSSYEKNHSLALGMHYYNQAIRITVYKSEIAVSNWVTGLEW